MILTLYLISGILFLLLRRRFFFVGASDVRAYLEGSKAIYYQLPTAYCVLSVMVGSKRRQEVPRLSI